MRSTKKTMAGIIVMMVIPEGEYEVNEEDNAGDNCDHPKSNSGLRGGWVGGWGWIKIAQFTAHKHHPSSSSIS